MVSPTLQRIHHEYESVTRCSYGSHLFGLYLHHTLLHSSSGECVLSSFFTTTNRHRVHITEDAATRTHHNILREIVLLLVSGARKNVKRKKVEENHTAKRVAS